MTLTPLPAASVAYPSIGFIGRKRAGKDAAAAYLCDTLGYEQLAFADPLRDIAERINPIIDKSPTEGCIRYRDAVDYYGYDAAKQAYREVRRFLQVLGTDAIREVLGQDVWVDYLAQRIHELDDRTEAQGQPLRPLVVTDVRFVNEVETLRSLGFMLVRIVRPQTHDGAADPHPSETTLEGFPTDVTVWNDSSLPVLHATLHELVATHHTAQEGAA